jgi:DNA primase catalytic subunit
MGRKEIVDYVSGVGLDLLNKGKYKSEKSKRKISKTTLSLSNFGWGLRLKKGMRKFIQTTKIYTLMEIGVSRKNAEVIFNNRVGIVERCIEENLWKSIKGVGPETWKRIVEHVKNQENAQIDTVVTSDIHRLIRANGTLHGKTGLMKVEFPLKQLDTFDPFVGAVAFKEGEAKVLVSAAPEFTLRGETFGPYKDKTVELPTAAAVLLVLKGRAQVVN